MNVLIVVVIGILMLITYLLFSFLAPRDKTEYDEFMKEEANRCLNNFCEVGKEWHSRGRIHTSGFAIIEKDSEKHFIRQSKLCDLGLLN